jgi:hypothetical protein
VERPNVSRKQFLKPRESLKIGSNPLPIDGLNTKRLQSL